MHPTVSHPSRRFTALFAFIKPGLAALTGLLLTIPAPAQGLAGTNFVARAEAEFSRAKKLFLADTNAAEAAWQLGRACFDLAEFATNDTRRAALAQEGLAATRSLTKREPKSAPGLYYLAMNLAQLARTKSLGALKLVDEMESLFRRVRDLDPQFDQAGPDRNLGLLYRDAPGWPASIGSRSKARQSLRNAARLAPDYPENRLNLVESYLHWAETAAARSEFDALTELWPKAKRQLSGDEWAAGWADWEKRRAKAQERLADKKPDTERRGRTP